MFQVRHFKEVEDAWEADGAQGEADRYCDGGRVEEVCGAADGLGKADGSCGEVLGEDKG